MDTQPPQLFFLSRCTGPFFSRFLGPAAVRPATAYQWRHHLRPRAGFQKEQIAAGFPSWASGYSLIFWEPSEISNVIAQSRGIYSIYFFSMFPSEPRKMTEAGLNSLPHLFPHWNDASMREPQQTTCLKSPEPPQSNHFFGVWIKWIAAMTPQ